MLNLLTPSSIRLSSDLHHNRPHYDQHVFYPFSLKPTFYSNLLLMELPAAGFKDVRIQRNEGRKKIKEADERKAGK